LHALRSLDMQLVQWESLLPADPFLF